MKVALMALAVMLPSGLSAADESPVIHSGLIEASVDDVWKAFTTKEGLESWMVPHADIELKIGGIMRTHYSAKGRLGDEGTISNTILSYDPKRMLSLKIAKPPAGFPFANAWKNMWTVIYFEDVTAKQTRITVKSMGYTADEESQKMRLHFVRGNDYTLKKLQQHFAAKHDVRKKK